jgi:hypothetical protein
MTERIEGWFRCEFCGHNAMPSDSEFSVRVRGATLLSRTLFQVGRRRQAMSFQTVRGGLRVKDLASLAGAESSRESK